ncbi:MAG TPA: hypothetical protein VFM55_15885 [Micromonosporaceae bacterium]|nr:hypothetical protein [Micromonosporaceae bacterium]
MKASRVLALVAAVLVLTGAVLGVGVWRGWLPDPRGWFIDPSVSGASELRLPEGAVRPLVTGLRAPWGLAFLPDGTALVTGALWVLTSNRDGRGSPARDDDRILRITV